MVKEKEQINPEEKSEDGRIAVVIELPTQPYNQVLDAGETVNLITITQALTEMYNDIKFIKKAVG